MSDSFERYVTEIEPTPKVQTTEYEADVLCHDELIEQVLVDSGSGAFNRVAD